MANPKAAMFHDHIVYRGEDVTGFNYARRSYTIDGNVNIIAQVRGGTLIAIEKDYLESITLDSIPFKPAEDLKIQVGRDTFRTKNEDSLKQLAEIDSPLTLGNFQVHYDSAFEDLILTQSMNTFADLESSDTITLSALSFSHIDPKNTPHNARYGFESLRLIRTTPEFSVKFKEEDVSSLKFTFKALNLACIQDALARHSIEKDRTGSSGEAINITGTFMVNFVTLEGVSNTERLRPMLFYKSDVYAYDLINANFKEEVKKDYYAKYVLGMFV